MATNNNKNTVDGGIDFESDDGAAALFDFSVKIVFINREMSEICRKAVESHHRGTGEYVEENKDAIYRAAIDAHEMKFYAHADDIYEFVMKYTSLDPEAPHPRELEQLNSQ
jgi:hypothetical protein